MPDDPLQESGKACLLTPVGLWPGFRALTWAGDVLYASRGYKLFRTTLSGSRIETNFEFVAAYDPPSIRRLTVLTRPTARLLRDGFHALCVLPAGDLIAAVPRAIVTLRRGETEFRVTHQMSRGTRPLHISTTPDGILYWGEYFDNASRDEVHIYGSSDAGATWHVAYTFPKRAVRHVHNIVHDPWRNCLWILTGDYGDECKIVRASYDFRSVEVVLQGRQQARAVAAIAAENGLYFASDTPLERNFIYRLDPAGNLDQLSPISSSSIYGCRVAGYAFFSTMVEPSEVNRDRFVRLHGASLSQTDRWDSLLEWKKDRWSMRFFQYGNAFLPDGDNRTRYLAVSTIAVNRDDMATSIYSVL